MEAASTDPIEIIALSHTLGIQLNVVAGAGVDVVDVDVGMVADVAAAVTHARTVIPKWIAR